MICIKCGKEENKPRRDMCLRCYRETTGFSGGISGKDSSANPRGEVEILKEILELKDKIKLGKNLIKQLPIMQKRFKTLKIRLSEIIR